MRVLPPRFLFRPALVAAVLLAAGCGQVFVPKHRVLVDAISAPGLPKPAGQSYRLLARKSVVNNSPVRVDVVKACVDAALSSAGMFEAPANTPSDLVVEVGFGQEATPRIDPAARETYLQLSARTNPGRSPDRATGPEIWDVKVSVLGLRGRVEPAMPLLCSVAVSYLGANTQREEPLAVPQNSPAIAAIREAAQRVLDAQTPPAPAPEPAGR